MLGTFFREGMPTYDERSQDKPNQYTSDQEDCSELFCSVALNEVLVCLQGGSSSNGQGEEGGEIEDH
jgi:hypothetical protein